MINVRPAIAALLLSAALAAPAAAQYNNWDHRGELHVYGGYSWTTSRDVAYGVDAGDIDIKSSGFWGVALDLNVRSGGQLELLYNRQESKLTYRPIAQPTQEVTDMTVEYWQIGGLQGVLQGQVLPFGSLSLGATHYSFSDPSIESTTKFSMIFGVGAKAYLNDRVGVRVQGRIPFTFLSSGGSVGCGPAGCYTTIGGSGIMQIDVSGGLFLMF